MDDTTKKQLIGGLIILFASLIIGFIVGVLLCKKKVLGSSAENLPFLPNLYMTGNAVQGALSNKLNSLGDKDIEKITEFGVSTYVNGPAGEFHVKKPEAPKKLGYTYLGQTYPFPLSQKDVSPIEYEVKKNPIQLGQSYEETLGQEENNLGYSLGVSETGTYNSNAYSSKRLGQSGDEDMMPLPRPQLGQSFNDPTNVSTHIQNKPLNLPLIQKTQGVDYIRGDLPIEPIRREWFDLARANPINLVAGGHNVLFGDKPNTLYAAKQQYESLGCGCAQSFLGQEY